ncbi:MAG: hypothetical protein U1F43_35885 [Myxococcota bacterium]
MLGAFDGAELQVTPSGIGGDAPFTLSPDGGWQRLTTQDSDVALALSSGANPPLQVALHDLPVGAERAVVVTAGAPSPSALVVELPSFSDDPSVTLVNAGPQPIDAATSRRTLVDDLPAGAISAAVALTPPNRSEAARIDLDLDGTGGLDASLLLPAMVPQRHLVVVFPTHHFRDRVASDRAALDLALPRFGPGGVAVLPAAPRVLGLVALVDAIGDDTPLVARGPLATSDGVADVVAATPFVAPFVGIGPAGLQLYAPDGYTSGPIPSGAPAVPVASLPGDANSIGALVVDRPDHASFVALDVDVPGYSLLNVGDDTLNVYRVDEQAQFLAAIEPGALAPLASDLRSIGLDSDGNGVPEGVVDLLGPPLARKLIVVRSSSDASSYEGSTFPIQLGGSTGLALPWARLGTPDHVASFGAFEPAPFASGSASADIPASCVVVDVVLTLHGLPASTLDFGLRAPDGSGYSAHYDPAHGQADMSFWTRAGQDRRLAGPTGLDLPAGSWILTVYGGSALPTSASVGIVCL